MGEAQLIAALLECSAGYDVGVLGTLGVRSAWVAAEDSDEDVLAYLVYTESRFLPPDFEIFERGREEEFPTALEAAERFLQKRRELRLGRDIEAEPLKQNPT